VFSLFFLSMNISKCPIHTEILAYVLAHITKNNPL
jgi:hypothetical protein